MATGVLSAVLAVLVVVVAAALAQPTPTVQDVEQMVTGFGYPFERHFVTTEDGFILQMFRIPHGNVGSGVNSKVMMLQHGLEDQGGSWAENDPTESLAYIAADNGYDVWLGNSRGNMWSTNHTSLSPDDLAFWNWTWQEMAQYDLPAQFEYALATNGQAQKGVYVGHSQGTMQAFAALSAGNTAIAAKIQYAVMLAPVAYLANIGAGLRYVADIPESLLMDVFGNETFLQHSEWDDATSFLCKFDPSSCDVAFCFLFGCQNPDNLNQTRLGVYTFYDPAGTSFKNMIHYQQAVHSDAFQMFDYGPAGNQAAYGQSTPPQYDVSQITVPLITVRGGRDTMADPTDVAKLMGQLPPVALDIYQAEYGHVDPLLGIDAHEKVYIPVLNFLAQHGA